MTEKSKSTLSNSEPGMVKAGWKQVTENPS